MTRKRPARPRRRSSISGTRLQSRLALHRVQHPAGRAWLQHSLVVSARQLRAAGETQDDADARVLAAIARFVTANS